MWDHVQSQELFVELEVKVNARYERESIFECWLKAGALRIFKLGHWIFQQDRVGSTKQISLGPGTRLKNRIQEVVRIASMFTRFEAAEIHHIGYFGGQGQHCPAHQLGLLEKAHTGRTAQITDEQNSYFDCNMSTPILGCSLITRWAISIKFAWYIIETLSL